MLNNINQKFTVFATVRLNRSICSKIVITNGNQSAKKQALMYTFSQIKQWVNFVGDVEFSLTVENPPIHLIWNMMLLHMSIVQCSVYFVNGCRFAGYDTGACRQPPPVVYTLKLLIGAAPVVCITTGLMILVAYPISEDVRLRNKIALEELRCVHHRWL